MNHSFSIRNTWTTMEASLKSKLLTFSITIDFITLITISVRSGLSVMMGMVLRSSIPYRNSGAGNPRGRRKSGRCRVRKGNYRSQSKALNCSGKTGRSRKNRTT